MNETAPDVSPDVSPDPVAGSTELAQQLRRWIVVAGYALSGWTVLQAVTILVAWGLPFRRSFHIRILIPLFQVAFVCYVVSPLVLLVGCWGFQRYRRWARPVLLTYAYLWVGTLIGVHGVHSIDFLFQNLGQSSVRQDFAFAVGAFDQVIFGSVYAVFVVLCLTRPEVKNQFPEMRSGFAPILASERR